MNRVEYLGRGCCPFVVAIIAMSGCGDTSPQQGSEPTDESDQEMLSGPGTTPARGPCDDRNPCTRDTGTPFMFFGGCKHAPVAAGTVCSNGNACDSKDLCDGNGKCVGTAVPDGTACPSTQKCFEGHCKGGKCESSFTSGAFCDDGQRCTISDHCVAGIGCVGTALPADDPCWGVPDPGVSTTLSESMKQLYSGANSQGTKAGAIDPKRVAIVRGEVSNASGKLAGVSVRVRAHDDYGATTTRTDGTFDLAVNGGEELDIVYESSGYLPVQRHVRTTWQDWSWAADVTMTPEAPSSGTFEPGRPEWQVIAGPPGPHQAVVAFPPGTTLLSGETGTFELRMTEYTSADDGAAAMPGELPPTSAYTFAIELRLWQGTSPLPKVEFNQPVLVYVPDFLGFKTGSSVPSGKYDREIGQWITSRAGSDAIGPRVISRNSTMSFYTGASAEVSLDECVQVIPKLPPLPSSFNYWRVPLLHFSALDFNWPFNLPDGALGWMGTPSQERHRDDECTTSGSIIGCESQTLGERVAIAGTPHSLVYRSDRVPGRSAAYKLKIPLELGATPPERVDIEVLVAGQRNAKSYEAPSIPPEHSFTWNGKDAFDRELQGDQPVTVRVGYAYPVDYVEGSTFAVPGDVSVAMAPGRQQVVLWKEWKGRIGTWNALNQGFGGWGLDALHTYSPAAQTLYLGDGRERNVQGVGAGVRTIVGTVPKCAAGDNSVLHSPSGIAIAPEGTLYIADSAAGAVLRKDPGQAPVTHMSALGTPVDVALAKDGSLYVVEQGKHQVIRRDPSNVVKTILGTGAAGDLVFGNLPGNQTALNGPTGVAIGPDGAVYVSDTNHGTVWRVDPTEGNARIVAGNGSFSTAGDDGPAVEAGLQRPTGLAFGLDGTMYVADDYACNVRAISPSGVIRTAIGGTCATDAEVPGDGLPANAAKLKGAARVHAGWDGALYVSDAYGQRVRKVGSDGIITTVIGTGSVSGCGGEGMQPSTVGVSDPVGVVLAPDGSLLVAERGNSVIRKISAPLPGLSLAGDIMVPSEDGAELYVFTELGRHKRTVDTRSGKDLLRFTFNTYEPVAGHPTTLLTSVEDARSGLKTTFDRKGTAGELVGIKSPFGQVTQVALKDNLVDQITDPAGGLTKLTWYDGGLLETLTDPRGKEHKFQYDDDGRLSHDTDPATASFGKVFKTLTPTPVPHGHEVSVATAENNITTYKIELPDDGSTVRTVTMPDGKAITTTTALDGKRTTTYPDGTLMTVSRTPDPRFGLGVPVAQSSVALPSGAKLQTQVDRTTEPSILIDPLAATKLIETMSAVAIDGTKLKATSEYTATTVPPALTTTTPGARKWSATFDSRGRLASVGPATASTELAPVRYAYDGKGRVWTITQKNRTTTLTYDPVSGFLTSISQVGGTDSRTVKLSQHDGVGRPKVVTLPGKHDLGLGYDGNGNITSVTPPGKPMHSLGLDDVELLHTYDAPPAQGKDTAQTIYGHDLERRLNKIRRADQKEVTPVWEPFKGRLGSVIIPEGTIQLGYDDAGSGKLKTLSAPGGITTTLGYDGMLLKGVQTAWPSSSVDVSWTRDKFLRVNSETVGGSVVEVTSFDGDGMATTVSIPNHGDYTVTPDPTFGWLDSTSIGTVETKLERFDDYGELQKITANSGALYSATYTPDGLGRIKSKTETVNGVATGAATYEYDSEGRLWKADGKTFLYDANGNLKSANVGGVPVSYEIDALGRRVGRTSGGATRRYLYGASIHPVAELDETGAVVSRFVYVTRAHVPDLMLKGTKVYRLITDHLGSVRLVVDVDSGTVAQRIDYDAWGNAMLKAGEWEVQPFGFAGGLYDPVTKFVHFGAREYDPVTGRWTRTDPILFQGGDANLYAYAAGDPVNHIDPSGLMRWTERMVDQLLKGYSSELDRAWSPSLLMLDKHRGAGEYDYATTAENDTFDVPGLGTMDSTDFGNFIAGYAAGYRDSDFAYLAVRGAGSLYGLFGEDESDLEYFGDNAESVFYIQLGRGYGFATRTRCK